MGTGCDRCDFHGPELPTTLAAWRDLHRSWHSFLDALFGPVVRWLEGRIR